MGKKKIKAAGLCLAEMLSWLPCLCAFSESGSLLVNAFGAAYVVVLYKAYKSTPGGRKAVRKYLKSIITLNPQINRI